MPKQRRQPYSRHSACNKRDRGPRYSGTWLCRGLLIWKEKMTR
nr:MAG TPA: hypothetical protein [Caudoviricetes sp.]